MLKVLMASVLLTTAGGVFVSCTPQKIDTANERGSRSGTSEKETARHQGALDGAGVASPQPTSIEPKPSGATTAGAGEEVSIPSAITGSYLTCAVRKEATEESLETEIGCRLTDQQTKTKLTPDASLSFSFSSATPQAVTSERQTDSSIYHVLYRIKGATRDAVIQTAQSLDAVVLYGNKTILTERVSRALKPAIELDDYEAPIVREQSIDKDDAGSL